MICFHCLNYVQQNKGKCPHCGKNLAAMQIPLRYLKPGTMLNNHYLLGYPMKSGGFGNTYIARNQMLKRIVAIKEFYPAQYVERSLDGKNVVLSDPSMRERYQTGLQQFIIEAKKVISLKSIRGVVDIEAYFEENNTGYIVMEFIEGEDVESRLKRSGQRMDYNSCLGIILPVLYTLRQLHGYGLIHCDIAPDNIMITKDGLVKLIDLGAAKHCAMPDATQEIFLKKGYAPIEQYGRSMPLGVYTDLYALAATFYRMLTGQTPVPANKRSAHDVIPTPTMLGARLPRYAEDAIMMCLNYRPEFRLQNAEQFMEALHCKDYVPAYERRRGDDTTITVEPIDDVDEGKLKGKIPLPILIGSLAAAVLIVFLASFLIAYKIHGPADSGTEFEAGTVTVPPLMGKRVDEVEPEIDSWISTIKGIKGKADDFTCTYHYTYDADSAEEIVKSQTPNAGDDVSFYEKGDADAEAHPVAELYVQDNKLHGNLDLTVQSSTRMSYQEILGLNAFSLSMKLGGSDKGLDNTLFEAISDESEIQGRQYYDILSIVTEDGTITHDVMENGAQKGAYLNPNEIVKVRYAAGDFFYWDSFPDYQGMNLYGDRGATGSLYRKCGEGEEDIEVADALHPLAGSSFIDDSYYSFTLEPGTILRQYPKVGETVDTSDLSAYKNGILMDAIARNGKIEVAGTGDGLRMRLNAVGFINVRIEGGDSSGKVIKCRAEKDGKTIKNDFFSVNNADKITIVLTTEEPAPKENTTTPDGGEGSLFDILVPAPDPEAAGEVDID